MTTNHHTPPVDGAPANMSVIRAPLAELDQAISDLALTEKDGHIIQDDGTDVAQQQRLDFVGAGVVVTNDAGNNKTVVTIPGGVTDHGALAGLTDSDHVAGSIEFTATDKLLGRSAAGAGAGEEIPITAAGRALIAGADAAAQRATLELSTVHFPNRLINGGFDIAQRLIAPGTLTTIADKGFGADRWQQFAENASWQYNRNDALGESGLTCQYYGLFKKITNAGKGIFAQKIEGVNSVPLRGKTVIFQIKMKASSAKTIRMAILELQNAGAIDTFPAAIASAFGANTVDPTWGANVAVITGVQSKSVTTLWQSFSVSVAVPSNSKNLVCVLWTDSQFAINDTLSVAEAGLFISSYVQIWNPAPIAAEIALCKRYYEYLPSIQFTKAASAYSRFYYPWAVEKRATPTVVVTDSAGNAGKITTITAADVATNNRAYIGIGGNVHLFTVTCNNADTDVAGAFGTITAEAEI